MAEVKWCSCNPLREAREKAEKWDAIVRCKDCAFFYTDEDGEGYCENSYAGLWSGEPDSFCSWGERK